MEAGGIGGLHRTLRFRGSAPAGLCVRLAVGRLEPKDGNAWRLNDLLTLRTGPGVVPSVFGEGNSREVRVPVRTANGSGQLEIDYAW
jgi:hypothetical protein